MIFVSICSMSTREMREGPIQFSPVEPTCPYTVMEDEDDDDENKDGG